jgi:small subunit ribosomal protein S1
MSTEPQVARVVHPPEPAGSFSQQTHLAAGGRGSEALTTGTPAPPAERLASNMTGRPAFPDRRDLIQPPDRREPLPDTPLETRPAPAPPAAEIPPAAVSAPQADAALPGVPLEPAAAPETAAADGDAINYDDWMAGHSEPAIRPGELCQGQIISIDGENVIVDYGGKTEGILPLAELREAGIVEPAAGQNIEVSVESLGGPGDYAVLSFLKAYRSRLWEQIEAAFRQKEQLTARVTERVKGGLTVDIGIPAFLPGSQADVRPVADLDALVGREIPVRIVKLSRGRGNVVV